MTLWTESTADNELLASLEVSLKVDGQVINEYKKPKKPTVKKVFDARFLRVEGKSKAVPIEITFSCPECKSELPEKASCNLDVLTKTQNSVPREIVREQLLQKYESKNKQLEEEVLKLNEKVLSLQNQLIEHEQLQQKVVMLEYEVVQLKSSKQLDEQRQNKKSKFVNVDKDTPVSPSTDFLNQLFL